MITNVGKRTMVSLFTAIMAMVAMVSGGVMYAPQAYAQEFAGLSSGSSFSGSPVPGNSDYGFVFEGRRVLNVDSCDLKTRTSPNTVVDVGFGNRTYWAYTNNHGQVIGLVADEIVLQDRREENSQGRYCSDEAKTDSMGAAKGYDSGHIVADSLGGAANIYNITPQNAYLNRYGEQSKMENRIRNAGGATDFTATIEYPNSRTDIPSKYTFSFMRNDGVYESLSFDNKDSRTNALW